MWKSLKFCALAVLLPLSAHAQSLDDVVDAQLLPGWRMENGRHMAALRLTLAPGWKTYWRAPGDAGIPPQFDWSGSANIRGAVPHWPTPSVFDQNGMRSVGYKNELTLPIEFAPQTPGKPMTATGRIVLGVCEDICIPVNLVVGAELPMEVGAGAGAIRDALGDRPISASKAGVGRVVCQVEPISDGLRVSVSAEMPRLPGLEQAVIEFSDPAVWVSEAQTSRDGSRLVAVVDMVPPEAAPFAMARDGVRLTVLGDGRAVDIQGCTAS
ncbi:MAG: protein-disulfide reductase DsbD domain-containing protein [Pseudomonadota bacterium]